jgi:ABC-type polysaccharide/polyol phosphate export permease
MEQSEGWVENRATRGLRGVDLRELWQYRELVGFLALRDVKLRYKQTAFGVAWAVLQPLAGVAVFTFVFRRLAGVPSDGMPYVVFGFVGYAAWAFVSGGVTRAMASLVENAALVTKVWFPRIAAPLAAVVPGVLDLAVSLVVLALLLVVTGTAPTAAVALVPLTLLWLTAVALGVGLWLAALNVQYRDVRQLSGLLLQLWLFASPVAYPTRLVPGGWRLVYGLNPLVGSLDAFRWSVAGGPAPGAPALVSSVVTVVVLVTGGVYLRHAERRFADVI